MIEDKPVENFKYSYRRDIGAQVPLPNASLYGVHCIFGRIGCE